MWLLSALDRGVKEHIPFSILIFVDPLPILIPRKIKHMAQDRLGFLNLLFSQGPPLGICCALHKVASKLVFQPPESSVHDAAFPHFQSHNVKVRSLEPNTQSHKNMRTTHNKQTKHANTKKQKKKMTSVPSQNQHKNKSKNKETLWPENNTQHNHHNYRRQFTKKVTTTRWALADQKQPIHQRSPHRRYFQNNQICP